MTRLLRAIVLIVFASVASSALATTYYIDNSATGCGGSGCSDANNGTSKTTAWKHAPGMPDCTSGGCFAIDNNSGNNGHAQPGDQFILRGGDTWSYANGDLPWTWRSSGTSGNVIYIGVDQTWYTGSAWTRPILNLSAENIFRVGGGAAFRFGGSGTSTYNTVDNFEFTNWSWTGACTGSCIYGPFAFDSGGPNNYDGNTLEHAYFHGWTHTYNTGDTDGCVIVGGQSSNVLYTVFDGSDSSGGGDSCYAIYFAGTDTQSTIAYNYVYGTANGFVGSYPIVHDNLIAFINQGYAQITSGSYHGNALENNVCRSPCFIYNNVSLRVNPSAGVTFWDSPTGTDYIFNNVIVNTTNGNVFDTQTGSGAQSHGGYVQMFNNTLECGQDSAPPYSLCSGDSAADSPGSTWTNNHFITSASPPLQYLGTSISNITQAKSSANGQGYSFSQSFTFSPTGGGGSTVAIGQNLQSLCGTIAGLNAAAGAACQSDTTYAVAYDSTNHTVSSPARMPLTRPTSGAWDAGAYQFSGSSVSSQTQPPQPPSNLQATPQ